MKQLKETCQVKKHYGTRPTLILELTNLRYFFCITDYKVGTKICVTDSK